MQSEGASSMSSQTIRSGRALTSVNEPTVAELGWRRSTSVRACGGLPFETDAEGASYWVARSDV